MNGLRLAARSLSRSPGFTIAALLVLGIGIGLNTAIFSVVDTMVLRPLPFPEPGRLIRVGERLGNFGEVSSAYPNFLDWSRQSKSITASTEVNLLDETMTDGSQAERVPVMTATAGFFDTVGIHPSIGRAFGSEDDRKNAPGRVVITYGFWKRRFAGDPKIAGHQIVLRGEPFTIVGVMPPDFRFPLFKLDAIVPLGRTAGAERGNHSGEAMARLKPGVTVAQANAELAAIGHSLSVTYPKTNSNWELFATSLQAYFTKDSRAVMLTLLAAVGLVLLLATVNIAGLMLVRAAGKRREIAVRLALGAGSRAILRENLNEALLIAAGGGVLGTLAASWTLGPLLSMIPESVSVPSVSIDSRVLAFTMAITLLASIFFALVPAWRSMQTDPNEALKEQGRGNTGGAQGSRLRSALVVAEIGLALVLTLAAALVLKSFGRLMQVDPGFDAHRAVTMSASISGPAYKEDAAQVAFWRKLLENAQRQPSLESIGMVTFLPMSENDTESGYSIEGRPKPKSNGETSLADNFEIGGDYFGTMGISLLKGRVFSPSDTMASSPVVIIDEEFARKNFPNDDPFRHRILYDDKKWQIVGVVRHVKDFGLDGASREQFYFSYTQVARDFMTITARPRADTASAIQAVQNAVREIDPGVPVFRIRPMADWLHQSTWRTRLSVILLSVFAGMSLILASVGVYGIMAYSMTQRRQEIGIRIALGATRGAIMSLTLRQAGVMSGIGVVLGILLALPVIRLLSALLFQVSPFDGEVLIAVAVALVAIGLAAAAIPAFRAANIDPSEAIRSE
ncbi:MAG TPA: ABC transporter permease [Bryobacteraceae bacterium]|nr:ABC transporter permease [Bryobacteraceae bacterium]